MSKVETILLELKEKLSEFEGILNKSQELENFLSSHSIELSDLSNLIEQKNKLYEKLTELINKVKESKFSRNIDLRTLRNLIKFLKDQTEFLLSLFNNEEKTEGLNSEDLNVRIRIYRSELENLSKYFHDIFDMDNLKSKGGKITLRKLISHLHMYGPKGNSQTENINKALEEIETGLQERGFNLTAKQKHYLKIRLSGFISSKSKLDIPNLCDAVSEYEKSTENGFLNNISIDIKQVLSLHTSELRRNLMKSKEAEPETIFEDGEYKLVKLVSRTHLNEESVNSDHCIGTSNHHIEDIIRGRTEIYSFRKIDNSFLLTVEYDIKSKTIVLIRGRNNAIPRGDEYYFESFLDFLKNLIDKVEIVNIRNLDGIQLKSGEALTHKGRENILDVDESDSIITGSIEISDSNYGKVKKCLSYPRIDCDLTDLSYKKKDKIEEIKGNVIDESKEEVSYKRLKYVGGFLNAWSATSLSLPVLQSVGVDLNAQSATSLSLPVLKSVGDSLRAGATSLSLPVLRRVGGGLYAPSATSLSLPVLKSVGVDLNAQSATSLSLPVLKSVGDSLRAESATSMSLLVLQSVGGDLKAQSATSMPLPVLKSVGGDLIVHSAISLSLPVLRSVDRNLEAWNATSMSLPVLQSVGGDLRAESATSLSLPVLRRAGRNLEAWNATSMSLPFLQSVGKNLRAGNATSLSFPVLRRVGGSLIADSTTSLSLPVLQSVGNSQEDHLSAVNATSLSFPALQRVSSYLYTGWATSLYFPVLQSVGGFLYAQSAEELNLPSFFTAKGIVVSRENQDAVEKEIDPSLHKYLKVGR